MKTVEEITAAIAARVGGKLAASWTYHHGDGREALRVLRFALADGKKTYRPIRPEGDGWVEGDPPGSLPLYRLPNLDGKATLFLTEGEKCADVVAALGLTATCSAHGAGAPKKTDWTPLAGRVVAILPDNDDAGRIYAKTVAGLLAELSPPARVKVIELPVFGKGDDVADWIKVEGRPPDELAAALVELADAAPEWKPAGEDAPPASAREAGLFTLAESRAEFGDTLPPAVIEGLLREGEILNVIAGPKVGKSFLAGNLAFAVAAGASWLRPEWRCPAGKVVIIDAELPPRVLNNRLSLIRVALELPEAVEERISVWPRWGTPPAPAVDGLTGSPLAELRGGLAYVRALQPRLIIIDPFYLFLPYGASENDNAEIGSFYRELNALAASCPGAAVALVHHTSKGLQGDKAPTDVGAGAGAFSRGAATHFVLREHEEAGLYVAEARCRTWPPPEPVSLQFTFPLWTPTAHDPRQLRGRPRTCNRAPEELSDGTFAELLDGKPKSKQTLVELLRSRHDYSKPDADNLVRSVIERHSILDLQPGADKDCGLFKASNGGKGVGFRFWKATP